MTSLTPLEPVVSQLESAEALDSAAKAIGKVVRDSVGRGPLKDFVYGDQWGQPYRGL